MDTGLLRHGDFAGIALDLLRPLPEGMLQITARGGKADG